MTKQIKLSELAADVLLSYEGACWNSTAEELRNLIKENPDLISHPWCIATAQRWKADAQDVLADYIENQSQDMYEGWEEVALECLQDVHYRRIQDILDEAFGGGAEDYLVLGDQVIID